MTVKFLLASFSALVILNSIFFGVMLLINSKGLIKNKILAFLLFGIALRTGKSIIILLFPNVPDSLPAIGLVGMGAIGPLTLFYTRALLTDDFEWSRSMLLHFIFSWVMGISLPFANNEVVFWLYFFSAIHMATYLMVAFSAIQSTKSKLDSMILKWLRILMVTLSVIWLVYAIQLYFQGLVVYLTATVVASLSLFVLLYHALVSHKIFGKTKRLARSDKNDELSRQLLLLMERDKLFRDSDLTIGKLAAVMKTKSYVISGVLNDYHGKSFPEFVNFYRIEEAQKLLQSKQHKAYSIEAIAFDCGFNTPSAFYTYFKKVTKLTPAEYRARTAELA